MFVKYACREGKLESIVKGLKSASIIDAIRSEKGVLSKRYKE